MNKPVVGLVPDDALEDSTLLMGLQSELDVEDDNKHGIKRSRSPSPRRLQGELAKRSKRPPASCNIYAVEVRLLTRFD